MEHLSYWLTDVALTEQIRHRKVKQILGFEQFSIGLFLDMFQTVNVIVDFDHHLNEFVTRLVEVGEQNT